MIYQRLQSTAETLIRKYGWLANFSRVHRGNNYDPSVGSYHETVSQYQNHVVRDSFGKAERPDTAEQENSIRLIAENGDYQIDDSVMVDGVSYRIFGIEPISPAQTNCAIILRLRR